MEQILELISREYLDVAILKLIGGIFLGSALGIITIYFASLNEYKFLRDKNHLLLGLILPPIGFVIVYVIGSNLALSLGMIGALSIVRFRTPIRSSYELVIYFLLLTIGISLKVNFFISIIITIFSVTCFLSFFYFPKKLQKKFFDQDLNNKFVLLVEFGFSEEIERRIINFQNLVSLAKNKDGVLSANFNFKTKIELEEFLEIYKDKILTYEIFNS